MGNEGNNETWMSALPGELQDLPLINLAIPGSHNSMTYGITSQSEIAPDAEPSTRRLNYFFPCFVRRWARTQSSDVVEQLRMGVRYFDLRVCQRDGKFYFAHGLYAMEVYRPLLELRHFLDTHPGEVVILDFQHFYAMNGIHHQQLHDGILECLGQRLYWLAYGTLEECTLNRCRASGKQILVIYRRCPIQLPKEFWPSYSWPTPWPNVASAKKLEDFLQNSLLSRKSTQGYVSQCILTPTGRYIALRFLSSLKKTAKNVDKKIHPWIANQTPGPFGEHETPKVNVFIADFVNLKDAQFCNWVIALNTKLCDCVEEQEAKPES